MLLKCVRRIHPPNRTSINRICAGKSSQLKKHTISHATEDVMAGRSTPNPESFRYLKNERRYRRKACQTSYPRQDDINFKMLAKSDWKCVEN